MQTHCHSRPALLKIKELSLHVDLDCIGILLDNLLELAEFGRPRTTLEMDLGTVDEDRVGREVVVLVVNPKGIVHFAPKTTEPISEAHI